MRMDRTSAAGEVLSSGALRGADERPRRARRPLPLPSPAPRQTCPASERASAVAAAAAAAAAIVTATATAVAAALAAYVQEGYELEVRGPDRARAGRVRTDKREDIRAVCSNWSSTGCSDSHGTSFVSIDCGGALMFHMACHVPRQTHFHRMAFLPHTFFRACVAPGPLTFISYFALCQRGASLVFETGCATGFRLLCRDGTRDARLLCAAVLKYADNILRCFSTAPPQLGGLQTGGDQAEP